MNTKQEIQVLNKAVNRINRQIEDMQQQYSEVINRFRISRNVTASCLLLTVTSSIKPGVSVVSATVGVISYCAGAFYHNRKESLKQDLEFQKDWLRDLKNAITLREEKIKLKPEESEPDNISNDSQRKLLCDVLLDGKSNNKNPAIVDEILKMPEVSTEVRVYIKKKLGKRESRTI